MINAITAEGISFAYGNQQIFKNISFSVKKGELLVITGANGAGKSTLIRLLLGELPPDCGCIKFMNEPIDEFCKKNIIGYVSQGGVEKLGGFPASVEEIVTANLYKDIGFLKFAKKQHKEISRRALAAVGMDGYARSLVSELSGGQKQRVLIARAIVNQPDILILDEPATGVDNETTASFYNLISELNKNNGLTVLMVTHDYYRARKYATNIVHIEDGSIVFTKQEGMK